MGRLGGASSVECGAQRDFVNWMILGSGRRWGAAGLDRRGGLGGFESRVPRDWMGWIEGVANVGVEGVDEVD